MTEHPLKIEKEISVQGSQAVFPDLLGIVLRRKLYLVLGVIFGIALGVLVYVLAPRKYESTSQILVLKKDTERPLEKALTLERGSSSSAPAQDFLETHRAVLKSPLVVGRAVEKADLGQLEMFRSSRNVVDAIVRSMKVERERDKKAVGTTTQILNVSFRGGVREECRTVVNAVLDSYQDFLNDSSRGPLKETLKLITEARKLIQTDLDSREKAYAEFRKNTPALWKSASGATLYQERLGNIDGERAALMRQQVELEATLAAVDAAMKDGHGPLAAMQIISGKPANREISPSQVMSRTPLPGQDAFKRVALPQGTLEDELLRLQIEEGKLLETLGPRHPEVVSVRDRIKTIQALLVPARIVSSKSAPLSERELRAARVAVDTKLGQMKQQLREVKRSQEALNTLFRKELEEAKKVFPYETQDDAFKRQIARSENLYENLMKRMEDLDLMSNVGGYDAQVISPPQAGEIIFPKATLVFPVALFLGLLVGFGLAYLAELTDKSFRTPEEIRTRLGLPVIGHIPVLKQDKESLERIVTEGGQLHPTLCTHYRSRSRDAEAYRGVRTSLYFSTRAGSYKTIQVTSPDMGDGKSTLAANLAISVAQSGKRVLLIDADFRRPQQNELFGLPNRVGFASVLSGSAELPEAVRQTEVPGLAVMTTGTLPPNPAELLTSRRFQEVLEALGEQYDLILVDTPPLLAVTDPSVVAPRVDGVVLTLRIGKQSRPRAERAREILATLGAQVLGVVVNAAQGSGASGYGGYGYGEYGNNRYYNEEGKESRNGKTPALVKEGNVA